MGWAASAVKEPAEQRASGGGIVSMQQADVNQ